MPTTTSNDTLATQIEIELPTQLVESIDKISLAIGKTRDEIMRAAAQAFLFVRSEGKFLTKAEVCEMLKISKSTLARAMKCKKNPIPHVRYGSGRVAFYEPDIMSWIIR